MTLQTTVQHTECDLADVKPIRENSPYFRPLMPSFYKGTASTGSLPGLWWVLIEQTVSLVGFEGSWIRLGIFHLDGSLHFDRSRQLDGHGRGQGRNALHARSNHADEDKCQGGEAPPMSPVGSFECFNSLVVRCHSVSPVL